MKQLQEYIMNEKLIIGKNIIHKKDKRFQNDDPWTEDCLSKLQNKYDSKYVVVLSRLGAIAFYKGRTQSLKNCICILWGIDKNGELIGDWGPNENLKSTLGKEILETLLN